MWKLLGDLHYAETAGIDIEKHLNSSIYKAALDELAARNPDNATYKMFEERFVKYNR
jgi:NitT/TauT family transport system substrate-binding protein